MTRLETVRLQRLPGDNEGTIGALFLRGLWLCFVLELPWRGNARNMSCIPPGEYRVRWSRSPTFGIWTYELVDVPGRGGIRLHSGNFAGAIDAGFDSHSRGCPLPGDRIGFLRNQRGALQRAVLLSGPTVRKIEAALERREFILEVAHASA